MRLSKSLRLAGVVLALLLAVSMLSGCVTGKDAKSAETALTDSTVRVPPGDPTKFWDAFSWKDMTKAEQDLWGVLGSHFLAHLHFLPRQLPGDAPGDVALLVVGETPLLPLGRSPFCLVGVCRSLGSMTCR